MGEGEQDFRFLPAGGQFHRRASDETRTSYGGWVAWDRFLQHCGVIAELAANYPLPRTSLLTAVQRRPQHECRQTDARRGRRVPDRRPPPSAGGCRKRLSCETGSR